MTKKIYATVYIIPMLVNIPNNSDDNISLRATLRLSDKLNIYVETVHIKPIGTRRIDQYVKGVLIILFTTRSAQAKTQPIPIGTSMLVIASHFFWGMCIRWSLLYIQRLPTNTIALEIVTVTHKRITVVIRLPLRVKIGSKIRKIRYVTRMVKPKIKQTLAALSRVEPV